MNLGTLITVLWAFILVVVVLALFGVIDVQTSPSLRVTF
jgi:hypothetical protein